MSLKFEKRAEMENDQGTTDGRLWHLQYRLGFLLCTTPYFYLHVRHNTGGTAGDFPGRLGGGTSAAGVGGCEERLGEDGRTVNGCMRCYR
jgi:hypothetical protein